MIFAIILFLIGLIALLGGAKLLVLGASQLASTFGISSLIIGLTVVSFGTSAPEIGISIVGAGKEREDLLSGTLSAVIFLTFFWYLVFAPLLPLWLSEDS